MFILNTLPRGHSIELGKLTTNTPQMNKNAGLIGKLFPNVTAKTMPRTLKGRQDSTRMAEIPV
jgi:hypothetical protein